jgi:hypothetical protein
MVVVAAVALGVSAVVQPHGGNGKVSCQHFRPNGKTWRSVSDAGGRERAKRQPIAEAMARCGTLQGRTRMQVLALLGRPNSPGLHRAWWLYEIGTEQSTFALDEASFSVHFDEAGHVDRTMTSRAG